MLQALPLARRFEVLEKPFYLDQLMAKVQLVVEPPGATLDRAWERSWPSGHRVNRRLRQAAPAAPSTHHGQAV